MQLSENALKVLEKRYFKKDSDGNLLEDWHAMITRIADNISNHEPKKSKRYYKLLDSGYFLPNSPTLMNAGNDLQQLSACFVLPIEDSMDSIFETIKNAALIHKSGGGTGFSFSRLRESDARVRSTNGVSSGPISFLKVYNAATDAVKQGGTRRGANMAILDVNHPQIMEFITCKENTNELTNFNISVGVTDKFMQAVHQDEDFELVSPNTGKVVKVVKAVDIFSLMVEMAHKNGEPGIIFLDRINDLNPTPKLGRIESTNPCGEQPLLPNEACNLGSINLSGLYIDGTFQWNTLQKVVEDSVEFLDDVISCSKFPLPQIETMVKGNRKIGLGIMGWSDLLFQMKLPYQSDEAVALAEKVMEFIDYHAKQKSMELAIKNGSFPNFEGSIYSKGKLRRISNGLNWKKLIKEISKNGIRNATVTTIAPTGTISMILDASSGIEPQFSLVYVKQVMDGEKLLYVNQHFEKAMRDAGLYNKELLEKVSESGSLHDIPEIPEEIKKVFVTAHDITPEWHIRMQAAFQKYTDNAVSKTINFGREATKDDIRMAFELSYESNCKGVTVYRDGSRENQVLNVGSTIKDEKHPDAKIGPRHRPDVTFGITQRVETGCGHSYVTINRDEEGACEVFIQMGKVGGCASAQLEAIARLCSLALRSRIGIDTIVRQLKGIRCPSPMWSKGTMITSCADAVAQALETFSNSKQEGDLYVKNISTGAFQEYNPKSGMSGTCPECGSAIEHSEGCMKCLSCGWSKC
jgi:ribonucleoside-diphosphate reductase alpha chain